MSEELINSSSDPCHHRVLYWHQTWVPYTPGDHSEHSKKLWSPCCKIPSADLEAQNHCAAASCLGEQMLVTYFSSCIWEWSKLMGARLQLHPWDSRSSSPSQRSYNSVFTSRLDPLAWSLTHQSFDLAQPPSPVWLWTYHLTLLSFSPLLCKVGQYHCITLRVVERCKWYNS